MTPGRCVLRECLDMPDPNKAVEMSLPERPYRALREACPRHLEMFGNIGLPILPKPATPEDPDA